MVVKYKKETLLNPGHTACSGCGQLLATRHVIDALGPNTIISNATGCLEVTTTKYGESAWNVPYIHSLFENPAAVGSGILAALKYKTRSAKINKINEIGETSGKNNLINPATPANPNVVVMAGDGSTFDIGFGLLAGMFERGDDIFYICYDNEGYQNTGGQFSGSTPIGSETTTTPTGKNSLGSELNKKDMISFALSQGVPYVATSSVAYPQDIKTKIENALKIKGPKYLQIFVPCVPGWGTDSKDTITIAKLVVETGFYPILEFINGKPSKQMKIKSPAVKIEEYLKLQARFKHLFKEDGGKDVIKKLQKICDSNIENYGLSSTSIISKK